LVNPELLQLVMPVIQLSGFSQCVVKLIHQPLALGEDLVSTVQEIVLHVLETAKPE
jgi:hypothetical protein